MISTFLGKFILRQVILPMPVSARINPAQLFWENFIFLMEIYFNIFRPTESPLAEPNEDAKRPKGERTVRCTLWVSFHM